MGDFAVHRASRGLHGRGGAALLRGMELSHASLLPVIQAAITPVILISGTGMLMLTLTNRMGRAVDRTRALAGQLRERQGKDNRHLESQLDVLYKRTRLIRWAVVCAVTSILVECLLVLAIFAGSFGAGAVSFGAVALALFVCSIGLLIGALVCFLRDIYLSLEALDREVEWAREQRPDA